MAVRALRYASTVHLEDMAYLIAHLRADPRAAGLAADVEAAVDVLKIRSEEWSSSRHEVVKAQSALGNVEESFHNAVRNARHAILQDVGHRRDSPKFLTYFPRGLAVLFKRPYAERLRAVRSLAERCAQDPSPKVQDQAGLLRAAAEQMHAACESRDDALVAESAAYGQLQIQKLASIDMCRRTGHRLTELYPREVDRVRSYFRWIERRTRPRTRAAGSPIMGSPTDTAPDALRGSAEAAVPLALVAGC
jgi:hypothetical protein